MENKVKLTTMVKTSGCAAKLAPASLHEVIDTLPLQTDERLLAGFETADDALVYKLDDETVCIQTVDFFPPMVDDAYTFGQIAAANALSDSYAMGAKPNVCMNLMCFPACLELSVMKEILLGGLDKVKEAGAIIAGGHTISDPTLKYGLTVTSFCKKEEVWQNKGSRVGDVLVLTKALGTGVVMTAQKAEMIETEEIFELAVESMCTLNKRAFEIGKKYSIHSATDITGFSLLGHSYEMASASGVSFEIVAKQVPTFKGAKELASLGLLPEGRYNNEAFLEDKVELAPTLEREEVDLLYDPQTSGGLLFSMSKEEAEQFVKEFGAPSAIIGKVLEKGKKGIKVI